MCIHSIAVGGAVGLIFLAGATATAQEFTPVIYELKEGSQLVDGCFCGHLPYELPLEGTMVLTRQPVKIVGELYEVPSFQGTAYDSSRDFHYAVLGNGEYYRTAGSPDSVTLKLNLQVNSDSGIVVATRLPIEAVVDFPAIDVSAEESIEPARDPNHIYAVHIVAAPAREESVRYQLVTTGKFDGSGSYFLDDCTFCGRLSRPVPVTGSFLLRDFDADGPHPTASFAVEELDIHSVEDQLAYEITGKGTYEFGGEFDHLQSMRLEVDVSGNAGVILDSGKVPFPEGIIFPEIVIDLAHENPASPVHVYSLHLVARPAISFRRGDSNDDGVGDISDAVHILLYLFSGGATPDCLEAADVDADGQHNVTDAVYLLAHLFQGGPPPPPPGLAACGVSPEARFGCAFSEACIQ
jgi:hypothetical protein